MADHLPINAQASCENLGNASSTTGRQLLITFINEREAGEARNLYVFFCAKCQWVNKRIVTTTMSISTMFRTWVIVDSESSDCLGDLTILCLASQCSHCGQRVIRSGIRGFRVRSQSTYNGNDDDLCIPMMFRTWVIVDSESSNCLGDLTFFVLLLSGIRARLERVVSQMGYSLIVSTILRWIKCSCECYYGMWRIFGRLSSKPFATALALTGKNIYYLT